MEELDRRRRRVLAAQARRRRRLAVAGVLVACAAAAVAVDLAAGPTPARHGGSGGTAAAAKTKNPWRAPAVRVVSGRHDRAVPILMYHVIAPPLPASPYPDLYVKPAEFARQMHWLSMHGFHAVTLRRVYDYWKRGFSLPSHPVVVSFDDGYHSQYSNALPVMRALHWPGVLNLEVRNTTPVWGLRPGLVRALIAAGWEIDSHTLTHPDLTTLDAAQLKREVGDSRTVLRREFHVPVDFFCYPSGRYDGAVIDAVRAAGYLGATTTQFGLADPAHLDTLARVRVNGSDGVAGLAAKLRGLGAR